MTQNRPAPGPQRQGFQQRSATPLLYLRGLPAWVVPGVLMVALIVGLAVHGIVGGTALVLVALMLAWLAAVSWPRLAPGGRMGRLTVIALVIAGAVIQALR